MSNKCYAPYIENILPAFLWDYRKIIISIPFEHHQTIGITSSVGFALQIKDALQEDGTEPIILKKEFSSQDEAWVTNIVTFQITDPALIARLKIGRFYKCSLAYLSPGKQYYDSTVGQWVTEPSEIGYWSTVGINKCTRLATPSVNMTAAFTSSFVFPYISNDEYGVDIEEKLYSVELFLYDEGVLLEKSGEIIVNYQLQSDNSATLVNYQFNTYFNSIAYNELVEQRLFIYTEVMEKGEELGLVYQEPGTSNYYILDATGQLGELIVELDEQYQYTDNFLTIAKQVYEAFPSLWSGKYTLVANYKTINNYSSTVRRSDIVFDFASCDEDLEVQVANDYDNGLITIKFADASPGGIKRSDWQNATVQGTPLVSDDVSRLLTTCANFSLIRKNLLTQQCIRLLHTPSLKNFFYKTEGYQDLGVEQGVSYEYILTYEKTERASDNSLQTKNLYSKSCIVTADFGDCFIYDDNQQLKLSFNPKVTSYKYITPQTKQETIGGKFPFIFENRAIRYREFPISFLISHLSDSAGYFASGLTGKYEFLRRIMQKARFDVGLNRYNQLQMQYLEPIEWEYLPTTQLTGNNIFIERQFKMAVLDWLTNGKPKIFKSPVEGNIVVKLINISMAPEDKLGRMLHTLTGTAIEIDEYSDKYLQSNNLLLYQTVSATTLGLPQVGPKMVLTEKVALDNGGVAYILSISNDDLVTINNYGYYIEGDVLVVKDDMENEEG